MRNKVHDLGILPLSLQRLCLYTHRSVSLPYDMLFKLPLTELLMQPSNESFFTHKLSDAIATTDLASRLTSLLLVGCNQLDTFFASTVPLPKLTKLILNLRDASDSTFSAFASATQRGVFPALQHLQIAFSRSFPRPTNEILLDLPAVYQHCPDLQAFICNVELFAAREVARLTASGKLQCLHIDCEDIDDDILSALRCCPLLRTLKIFADKSDFYSRLVDVCTSIVDLHLRLNCKNARNNHLRPLLEALAPNLQRLRITPYDQFVETTYGLAGVLPLSDGAFIGISFPRLKYLELIDVPVSNSFLQQLPAQCPMMTGIKIVLNSRITAHGVVALFQCRRLRAIKIENCKVRKSDLQLELDKSSFKGKLDCPGLF